MGQYYIPVNLDKSQWLYSHDYKNRWKRSEDGQIFITGQGL